MGMDRSLSEHKLVQPPDSGVKQQLLMLLSQLAADSGEQPGFI